MRIQRGNICNVNISKTSFGVQMKLTMPFIIIFSTIFHGLGNTLNFLMKRQVFNTNTVEVCQCNELGLEIVLWKTV